MPRRSDRPRAVDLRGSLARLVAHGHRATGVPEEIAASWRRSMTAGLRSGALNVPFDPDRDRDGLLVRAAGPVVDEIARDLAGAGVGVVLADARGRIVERRLSDASLRARLDELHLAPGYTYAEDAVGTNAIGTALAQRRPANVEGDEHFADALTAIASAAAPIVDPGSGRTLGAVGLACLAAHANPLMLPFGVRAARDVEQRLAGDAGLSDKLALHRFLHRRRGAKGPFVLLTEQRMIVNAAADRLVDPDDERGLREAAHRLRAAGSDDCVSLDLRRGDTVFLQIEPTHERESPDGIVLRLTPAAHVARRRGVAPAGWDSLTETERSVSELVAQGLTNREAAERLFLSRHTVGFHLRSIFRKLGASSRVEVTRVVLAAREEEIATIDRPGADGAVPRFAL